MKYRKTEEIEAVIWNGDNEKEVYELIGKNRFMSIVHYFSGEVELWYQPNPQYSERKKIEVGYYILKSNNPYNKVGFEVWCDKSLEGFEPVNN